MRRYFPVAIVLFVNASVAAQNCVINLSGQENNRFSESNIGVFQALAEKKGLSKELAMADEKSFQFVNRPPEEFTMGSPDGEVNFHQRYRYYDYIDIYGDQPQHRVVLSKSYEIQKTPVTQLMWYLVMGKNWARFKNIDE